MSLKAQRRLPAGPHSNRGGSIGSPAADTAKQEQRAVKAGGALLPRTIYTQSYKPEDE